MKRFCFFCRLSSYWLYSCKNFTRLFFSFISPFWFSICVLYYLFYFSLFVLSLLLLLVFTSNLLLVSTFIICLYLFFFLDSLCCLFVVENCFVLLIFLFSRLSSYWLCFFKFVMKLLPSCLCSYKFLTRHFLELLDFSLVIRLLPFFVLLLS